LGGEDVSLTEYQEVVDYITRNADPEALIICGLSVDATMGDKVQVTVIATGFMGENFRIAKDIEEPEQTRKPRDEFIEYEEFKKFTDHSNSASSEFLNPRNYNSDDLEVPTVLRERRA
jgi:cell division protein FtsZ